MGPLPSGFDKTLKFMAVFALIGLGAVIGWIISLIYWMINHVRFV